MLSNYDIRVAFRCIKKLRSFIPSPKDPVPPFSRCGVVYEIKCKDCDNKYIGQTKNSLNTRLQQHKAALRLCQPDKSAIAEHAICTGHQINWTDPKVLDRESRWRHRLFLEAWHTNAASEQCLNRCECFLPTVYRALFIS